jgi:methyltransferase family protein
MLDPSGDPLSGNPTTGQAVTSLRDVGKSAAWWVHGTRGGRRAFVVLQAFGVHVMPNHFYSPIPDTSTLHEELFRAESEMAGVDMREAEQIALINEMASEFRSEYEQFPRSAETAGPDGFYLNNLFFESVDAESLYAYLRHFKPRRIIEIGSGYSTLVTVRAAERNRSAGRPLDVTCIEPFPRPFISKLADGGHIKLIPQPVEAVDLAVFGELAAGDVLFIDSSHILRMASDVQYEFLEILPRVAPGVHVHVHDIFFPREYPRDWVVGRRLFLNEQYLLQAFLAFNSEFEITLCLSYLHRRHPDLLRSLFDSYDPATANPGSFWMQRRPRD